MAYTYDCENECRVVNIIIETVLSLWTWLWSRCHVPQNLFPVSNYNTKPNHVLTATRKNPHPSLVAGWTAFFTARPHC